MLILCALLALELPALASGQDIAAALPSTPAAVRPGPGVTAVKRLADYHPGLAGTPGDTTVYVLEGRTPGGTAFVAGGAHGDEPAGIVAAALLVERAQVRRGRLIVVPWANRSAVLSGSRRTNPRDQDPDPDPEAGNLNRVYPGRPDGTLTQRVAFAIMALLRKERVDLAFDLHECAPDSPLAWAVVAHPDSLATGAAAVLALEQRGLRLSLECSSHERGLSHREWGDGTQAQAFLLEVPGPAHAGAHLAAVGAILAEYNRTVAPERRIDLTGLPALADSERPGPVTPGD